MNNWNMITDMKVYDTDKEEIVYPNLINVEQCEIMPDDDDFGRRALYVFSLTIPLYTFPEPDSQGNKCWSGDLFHCGLSKECIYFDGFSWRRIVLNANRFNKGYQIPSGRKSLSMKRCTRICSAFDPNATELTGLDQDTITKLKNIVIGGTDEG
jgi:hypothetical protein